MLLWYACFNYTHARAHTIDFKLLVNEIDQSTHVIQIHVIFNDRTLHKNHVNLDHVCGLINFICKKSEID